MPNASIARTTASTAQMNSALNAQPNSLLTLMTPRAHRIVEMATLVILKLGIVLSVTNPVLYATELKIPCATLVMMVGTSIMMLACYVKLSVVSARDQLILNVQRVSRATFYH